VYFSFWLNKCTVAAAGDAPPSAELLLAKMPPLPSPNLGTMRREAALGSAVVASICGGCITVGHLGAHLLGDETPAGAALLALIYAQAVLALGCLAGLLLGDPGAVTRGAASQLPVPAEVAARLAAGEPLDGLANVENANHGSYCVRCCVWRPPPEVLHAARQARRAAAGPCGPCVACWFGGGGGRVKKAHHCQVCLVFSRAIEAEAEPKTPASSLPDLPALCARLRPPLRRVWPWAVTASSCRPLLFISDGPLLK
jgi:hypothetical protein